MKNTFLAILFFCTATTAFANKIDTKNIIASKQKTTIIAASCAVIYKNTYNQCMGWGFSHSQATDTAFGAYLSCLSIAASPDYHGVCKTQVSK